MKKIIEIPQTDLSFFPIGLGTVNAGLSWNSEEAARIFDSFLDCGGSLIDTAHVYSDWIGPERSRSERVIGEWLKRSGKRNHIVLMSKGGHPDMTAACPDMHKSRMKKSDMRSDLEGSLQKLHTDHIDIYFYHRDDTQQTTEELIETMEEFRREGKIRYYACSNWSADRMRQADEVCTKKGYRGFVADQSLWNAGYQYMMPMPDDTLGYADSSVQEYHAQNPQNILMPYTSICGGFFQKYINGETDAVKDSPYLTEGNIRMSQKLLKICEKYQVTVLQAVLGFFVQQDFQCVPLYSPRNAEQMEEAMKTFEFPFCREDYNL